MEMRQIASFFRKKRPTQNPIYKPCLKEGLIRRKAYAILARMRYKKEPTFTHETTLKTGVLLVNLGTPTALDYFSMRRYLNQFLMDPRVVELNPVKWWLILNGILLNFIPFKSARGYSKIWDQDKNDSPLRITSYKQRDALQAMFDKNKVVVEIGMRYDQPSIESALDTLKEQFCDRILVVPLYPQYAGATTASVCDEVFRVLRKTRWMPALRVAPAYHDHPTYIQALANSVKEQTKDQEFDLLVTSYHGIPERYFKNGDPYHCHCQKTTRLLREALGLTPDKTKVSFQSQFGKEQWLTPSTEDTLEKLPSKGFKNIAIMTPGFSVDCVETLEEIAVEGKEAFMEHGGESYTFIPCLNDTKDGMQVIKDICDNELKGWL